MKCNHCGWNDNGSDTHCIKCGNPLSTSPHPTSDLPTPYPRPDNTETIRGAAAIARTEKPAGETIRGASAHNFSETITGIPAPTGIPATSGPAGTPGDSTIDPYRQPPPKEFFLSRIDAKDTPTVLLPFSTTSASIDLNRASLDSDNNTITSKVQAKVTFSEGKWFIIDCSEKKSTFIRVGEQHELKDGDILLIGNKRFVFSSKHPTFFQS